MGHSQTEKAESRERILEAASRQVRQGGLDSVSIPQLMKKAGLTHGAFYAHFPSRADLLVSAVDRALSDGEAASTAAASAKGQPTLKAIVNSYLTPQHSAATGRGCAVSALVGDAARADEEVRELMRKYFQRFISKTTEAVGDNAAARKIAVSSWCTMVGALALSRLFDNEKDVNEILREARSAILEREHALMED